MTDYYTKALHYVTVEGCRIETYLRYSKITGKIGITTTYRGNYTAQRAERAAYARGYRKDNPEAEVIRIKKWCDKNPEYHKKYLHQYHVDHKEEHKARDKKYFEEHKGRILARNRRYATDHPRDPRDYILPPYQCTKLNDWFDGCCRHHVDPFTIVHVPKEMHVTTPHNIRTGEGMDAINDMAFEFISMR